MSGPAPKTPDSLLMMSSSVSDSTSDSETPFSNSATPTERSRAVPKPPTPPKSRSSTERIVDGSCRLEKIAESRLFTDHENLYPFGLWGGDSSRTRQEKVERLLKYSVSLKMGMAISESEDSKAKETEAEGQACLIASQHGIILATVKHNFCTEFNEDGHLEECGSVFVTTPNDIFPFKQWSTLEWEARYLNHEGEGAFKFNSDGNPNAGWKYGKELVFLPLSDQKNRRMMTHIKNGKISTFQAVSTDFKCEEGMEVGIMACSCVNLLAESMQEGLRSENYEAQRGDTFITVGKITHVGADHIEYNVNTVPGFSGAPVFLLAPGGEQDMQLVAIHAGYSEALEKNFGFLVAKTVEKYDA